jgi:uncharacterized protein YebE (UPF0316 family)
VAWLIGFIFLAEMCVVTLSTLRTIFLARGMRVLAPLLGFFEVSIWLFAVGQVMRNLDGRCALAFAGGFTAGTFLGILIEQKLALGSVVVRTITTRDAAPLLAALREAGYGMTCLPGRGATGPVQVVLTVVPRRTLGQVIAILKGFDPAGFYSVDALQSAAAGVAPAPRRLAALLPRGLWPALRLFFCCGNIWPVGTISTSSRGRCRCRPPPARWAAGTRPGGHRASWRAICPDGSPRTCCTRRGHERTSTNEQPWLPY